MRHLELYRKYKANYRSITNPVFSKWHLPITILVILLAVLIEPVIIYKSHRSVPFTWEYYINQIEYVSMIVIPFGLLILRSNWREFVKRNRGYGWIGKFEVLDKRVHLFSHYLLLTPGQGNEIAVNRELFDKIRIGDFITVSRDALGSIEEIKKVTGTRIKTGKIGCRKACG